VDENGQFLCEEEREIRHLRDGPLFEGVIDHAKN
jgi:hypothetical protein